jgi:hypothetical protein
MERYAGWIDRGWRGELVDCAEIVWLSDSILATGEFNPSDPVLVWGRDRLYEALWLFREGTGPLTDSCRGYVTGEGGKGGELGGEQAGKARQYIGEALKILIPAIDRLAQNGY